MPVPASAVVQYNPSVLAAGAQNIGVYGMVLTQNPRVPIGTAEQFFSPSGVSSFFGASSAEYAFAQQYFLGFAGAQQTPGALWFTQYPLTNVKAWLLGGSVANALAAIQAITSGALSIVIDGITRSVSALDFASSSSLAAVANTLQTALNASPPAATFTATINNGSSGSGNVLTVSVVSSGTISVGALITAGVGVTGTPAIVAQTSGTPGGVGVYTLSANYSIASESMTSTAAPVTVTYDTVSGGLWIYSGTLATQSTMAYATGTSATTLALTAATGAMISQGQAANAVTPASFMTNLTQNVTTNFTTFCNLVDPDGGSGNTLKMAFATWNGLQNNLYAYVCGDNDPTPSLSASATSCMGYLLAQSEISGTSLIWEGFGAQTAFVMGAGASINFNEPNGRITFAYKNQSGLTPTVTTQPVFNNLLANGYNFYADIATENQSWNDYYPGSVSGQYAWLDSYINQIWFGVQVQATALSLFNAVKSLPYNGAGYETLRLALVGNAGGGPGTPSYAPGPILTALAFGMFGPGQLSSTQYADIVAATGNPSIPQTIAAQGWYLQIVPATAAQRAARQPPPINFWYLDQGSIQQLQFNSVEVQ